MLMRWWKWIAVGGLVVALGGVAALVLRPGPETPAAEAEQDAKVIVYRNPT